MMRIILSLVTVFSLSLMASSGGGETDIVARTINFVIFAMIMYYLLANPAKEYFSSRSEGIKERLEEVQIKLQETKKEKEDAKNALLDAEKLAEDIVATAKQDALYISEKIEKQTAEHLKALERHADEIKELELRATKKVVVEEIVDGLFEDASLNITEEEIAQKLLHKVA
jgi:F-type H+-transporting ATPase subunit b